MNRQIYSNIYINLFLNLLVGVSYLNCSLKVVKHTGPESCSET